MDPRVWLLLLPETLQALSPPREGLSDSSGHQPSFSSLPATPAITRTTRTPQKCCFPMPKKGGETSCISLNTGRNLLRMGETHSFLKKYQKETNEVKCLSLAGAATGGTEWGWKLAQAGGRDAGMDADAPGLTQWLWREPGSQPLNIHPRTS